MATQAHDLKEDEEGLHKSWLVLAAVAGVDTGLGWGVVGRQGGGWQGWGPGGRWVGWVCVCP